MEWKWLTGLIQGYEPIGNCPIGILPMGCCGVVLGFGVVDCGGFGLDKGCDIEYGLFNVAGLNLD